MRNSSYNIFSELNTDVSALNAKNTMMVDAINATLTTTGENQLILQNMLGNENFSNMKDGYRPVAVAVYNNIAYILSGKFDTTAGKFISAELGSFPSPDWTLLNQNNSKYYTVKSAPLIAKYAPLHNFLPKNLVVTQETLNSDFNYNHEFNTDQFNLQWDRLVEMEVQPAYDGSVNLIITDNYNPIRIINTRFSVNADGKTASLADRRQKKDTNTYSDYETRFNSTALLRSGDKIVDLAFDGVFSGGAHKGGGYRFFFRYIDSDGTTTDVIEESRLVVMGYNNRGASLSENTGKLVKFTLTNLDKKFSGVKVYFSKGDNPTSVITTVHEIINVYDILGDSLVITIYGNEDTVDYDGNKLNLTYSSINTARTMTQFDDRLLIGNLTSTSQDYDLLRNISKKITINEASKTLLIRSQNGDQGYAKPENVYNLLGYWAGETYEIGIVYILKDNSLSPVMPVRGGDNYYGKFKYTSKSIDSFQTNGFAETNSSENILGVWRTKASKQMLLYNGTSAGSFSADTTEVRYLQLKFTSILNSDEAILKRLTNGYFIVRKERKKDCLVQGFTTNTTRVPINQKIAGTYYEYNSGINWAEPKDQIHIQDVDNSIGSDQTYALNLKGDYDDLSFKIIPAPGRIAEITLDNSSTNTRKLPVTMQGVTTPVISWWHSNTQYLDKKGKLIPHYWGFYAADQLANPALLATIFDNSEKGLMFNAETEVVKANSIVAGNSSVLTGIKLPSGNTLLYSYTVANDPPIDTIRPMADKPINIYLTFAAATAGKQAWRVEVQNVGANHSTSVATDVGNLVFNIVVDETGTIISCVSTSNNYDRSVYDIRVDLTASYFPFLKEGDSGIVGKFSIKNTSVKYDEQYSDDDTLTGVTYTANVKISSSSFEPAKADDITQADPIKVLNLENFSWSPENPKLLVNNKYYLKYIGYGIDAYSNNQFSAIEDRNIYYVLAKEWNPYEGKPNWELYNTGGKYSTGPHTKALFTSITQYSEYIGIKAEFPDNYLVSPLHFDPVLVNNYGIEGKITTSNGIAEYVERVQKSGFNLAVLTNVYDSPNGALLELGNWQDKYNLMSSVEPYFAVTKRKTWSAAIKTQETADVFSGDCYTAYVYKRIMLPRGIPGVETATDPAAYQNFNQAVGLSPKGFVMPIVTENNYNVALRTLDPTFPSEQVFYAQSRSFYPIQDIESLRASRQKESTAYNFGYNDNVHDKIHVGLNDRSPSFNSNYSNRIMVSAPSVSGSFTNGYLDFSGLNFRDYNKQFGQIIKLISHNNDVYCVFEQGIGIIPVNQKTMVSEQDGGVFIDNAQVLAPKMQVISTEYGSDQQFSIVKTDQAIYGCDLRKNYIV